MAHGPIILSCFCYLCPWTTLWSFCQKQFNIIQIIVILYLLVLDFFFSCFFLNNSCKKNYFLTRSLTHLHYCKKNPLSSPTPHFICSALLTLSVIATHEVSVSGHFMPCYSCGHINEEVRFCIFSGQNETNSMSRV